MDRLQNFVMTELVKAVKNNVNFILLGSDSIDFREIYVFGSTRYPMVLIPKMKWEHFTSCHQMSQLIYWCAFTLLG